MEFKTKRFLTIVLSTIVVVYLITSFILWDLDTSNWSLQSRGITSTAICFGLFIGILISIEQ